MIVLPYRSRKNISNLRGWSSEKFTIDYDLTNYDDFKQNSIIYLYCLQNATPAARLNQKSLRIWILRLFMVSKTEIIF